MLKLIVCMKYRKTGFFGKIRFLQLTDARLTEYYAHA